MKKFSIQKIKCFKILFEKSSKQYHTEFLVNSS